MTTSWLAGNNNVSTFQASFSSNLSTWARSTPVSGMGPAWSIGAWSPTLGLWVICNQDAGFQELFTSPNGTTWTHRTSPFDNGTSFSGSVNGGAWWTGSKFLAGGQILDSGTGLAIAVMAASSDGITWTTVATPFDATANANNITDIYGSGNRVDAVSAGKVMYSTDGGVTWTLGTYPGSGQWASVITGGGLWMIGAASTTHSIFTSSDGITFTYQPTTLDTLPISCFSYDGTRFFTIAGASGINGLGPGNPGGKVYTSTDGVTWTHQAGADSMGPMYLSSDPLGNTVVIGSSSAKVTSDGVTYTAAGSPFGSGGIGIVGQGPPVPGPSAGWGVGSSHTGQWSTGLVSSMTRSKLKRRRGGLLVPAYC